MITIHDCLGLCDAAPEEVAVVGTHQHLADALALEKAHALLQQPWGGPALRQMIQDEARRARREGRRQEAESLRTLLVQSGTLHPGGIDRRHQPR